MKKIIIFIFLIIPGIASAEIVTLKSGKSIEGTIIEKTSQHIRIQNNEGAWKIPFKMMDSSSENALSGLSDFIDSAVSQEDHLDDDPVKLHQKIEKLCAQGQYDQALGHAQKLLELFPDEPMVQLYISNIFRELGENERALIHAQKAIALDSNSAYAHIIMAGVLDKLGKKEDAMTHVQKAFELNPEEARQIITINKEYSIPKKYYKNGQLRQEGEYVDGKMMAKLYYESGELEQEIFFKDGQRDGLVKTYYKNGKLQSEEIFKNGKPVGSGKRYSRDGELISVFSLNVETAKLYQQAIEYEKAGQFDLAIGKLTKVIALYPDFADAYINRGLDYTFTGNSKRAIEDFNVAIKINPFDPRVYESRAMAFINLGNMANAVEDVRKAQDLDYSVREDLLEILKKLKK